jgi:hypothetical protein
MRKFKMTLKDMNRLKITLGSLIRLDNLGYVGFDNEIVDAMIKFDIFPDLIEYRGDIYVRKDDIFGVVQRLLRSSMKLYEAVETVDNHVEKVAKELAAAVPLTAEELAKVSAGEMTMDELIRSKKTEVVVEDDPTVE